MELLCALVECYRSNGDVVTVFWCELSGSLIYDLIRSMKKELKNSYVDSFGYSNFDVGSPYMIKEAHTRSLSVWCSRALLKASPIRYCKHKS